MAPVEAYAPCSNGEVRVSENRVDRTTGCETPSDGINADNALLLSDNELTRKTARTMTAIRERRVAGDGDLAIENVAGGLEEGFRDEAAGGECAGVQSVVVWFEVTEDLEENLGWEGGHGVGGRGAVGERASRCLSTRWTTSERDGLGKSFLREL
ncbi:hypothetical protein BCR35DRAFT_300942 [Leucosporidium creatinivorum]|uniref:Uncharacterized protein n=1 Tax=Leucosporidium creatinivorum TaxID=106004 RepID=A0A1Y2G0Y5_9BASI|nr:hypothetical protein BCR35DRAFT_300942 [Leucosporidium creatinivorum]